MNRTNYTDQLLKLTTEALKFLAIDTRAQVDAGLMSGKEAHDILNCISAAIMSKEVDKLSGVENVYE